MKKHTLIAFLPILIFLFNFNNLQAQYRDETDPWISTESQTLVAIQNTLIGYVSSIDQFVTDSLFSLQPIGWTEDTEALLDDLLGEYIDTHSSARLLKTGTISQIRELFEKWKTLIQDIGILHQGSLNKLRRFREQRSLAANFLFYGLGIPGLSLGGWKLYDRYRDMTYFTLTSQRLIRAIQSGRIPVDSYEELLRLLPLGDKHPNPSAQFELRHKLDLLAASGKLINKLRKTGEGKLWSSSIRPVITRDSWISSPVPRGIPQVMKLSWMRAYTLEEGLLFPEIITLGDSLARCFLHDVTTQLPLGEVAAVIEGIIPMIELSSQSRPPFGVRLVRNSDYRQLIREISLVTIEPISEAPLTFLFRQLANRSLEIAR